MKLARILLNKVDDAAGSGGGGGDTKPLTAEDVAKIVNGAVTAHTKRLEASFEKRLAAVEAARSKAAAGDDDEDDDEAGTPPPKKVAKGGEGAAGLSPEVEKRIRELEKTAKSAVKLAEEERTKRTEAEQRQTRLEERSRLADGLIGVGVQKDMLEPALALLHTEQKRVRRGDDGEVYYHKDEATAVPLADGLKEWAATPLGQRFLPAKDVGGSGNRGGGKPGAGGKTEYSDADLGGLLFGQQR